MISYVIAGMGVVGLFALVWDGVRNKDKHAAQRDLRIKKFGKYWQ